MAGPPPGGSLPFQQYDSSKNPRSQIQHPSGESDPVSHSRGYPPGAHSGVPGRHGPEPQHGYYDQPFDPPYSPPRADSFLSPPVGGSQRRHVSHGGSRPSLPQYSQDHNAQQSQSPGESARHSRSGGQSQQAGFNRYPAYDSQGHRAGLEHVRHDSSPSQGRGQGYYRFRPQMAFPSSDLSRRSPSSPISEEEAPVQYEFASYQHRPPGPEQHTSLAPSHYEHYQPMPNSYRQPSSSSSHSSEGSGYPSPDSRLPSPAQQGPQLQFPDATEYLRNTLNIPSSLDVNLDALEDPRPGEKPNQPYPTLIKLAIHGSPTRQLTLQGIFKALEMRFEYFRNKSRDAAWKSSIRHQLSLNKVFRRVPRPLTEPGKGSYWQLDISEGEGYKRPRKRKGKTSQTGKAAVDGKAGEISSGGDDDGECSPSGEQDEDSIDPELRGGVHRIGMRHPLRPGPSSPYPSQSHSPQSPPFFSPSSSGQPSDRLPAFGQPSPPHAAFGQTSFGQRPSGRVFNPSSTSYFPGAFQSSDAVSLAPVTIGSRPPLTHPATFVYDGNAPIPQQNPGPGVEVDYRSGRLPTSGRAAAAPPTHINPAHLSRSGTGAPTFDSQGSRSSSSGSNQDNQTYRSRS